MREHMLHAHETGALRQWPGATTTTAASESMGPTTAPTGRLRGQVPGEPMPVPRQVHQPRQPGRLWLAQGYLVRWWPLSVSTSGCETPQPTHVQRLPGPGGPGFRVEKNNNTSFQQQLHQQQQPESVLALSHTRPCISNKASKSTYMLKFIICLVLLCMGCIEVILSQVIGVITWWASLKIVERTIRCKLESVAAVRLRAALNCGRRLRSHAWV